MADNIKLNIIDRLIRLFAPSYAAKRIHARSILMKAHKPMIPRRRVISTGLAPFRREQQSSECHSPNTDEIYHSNLSIYQQPEKDYPQDDDLEEEQYPLMPSIEHRIPYKRKGIEPRD